MAITSRLGTTPPTATGPSRMSFKGQRVTTDRNQVRPTPERTVAPLLWWHAALSTACSLYDAALMAEWRYVAPSAAIEAFMMWRLWRRGRIAWWVGGVLSALVIPITIVGMYDPSVLTYRADTPGILLFPLPVLSAACLAIWLSQSIRWHVLHGPHHPSPHDEGRLARARHRRPDRPEQ